MDNTNDPADLDECGSACPGTGSGGFNQREWARVPLGVALECNRIHQEARDATLALGGREVDESAETRRLWTTVMRERDRITMALVRGAGLDFAVASDVAFEWVRCGPWLPPGTEDRAEWVVLAPREVRDGHGQLLVVPVDEDDPGWLSVVCRRCGVELASGPASMRSVLLGLFGIRLPQTRGGGL
ncbi:hypothetical protein [Streptoalloteichus hindustanus]|uniref:Uncharacterized protein n=1 Tax=Streptoalloteichus hindustanus TaxID=2017 RepID=A0A1M5QGF1_STRHI|nr:hypothetical protein [Streptoalloteichus hindustanus]SHH12839.1 hypothetical protein SAMN05444320_12411 [Streptoalloteichus hindustanus]